MIYNIDKKDKMGEVEYQCEACGEYFEALPGGADCPLCGSDRTEETDND